MPIAHTEIEPPALTDFDLTEDAVSTARRTVDRVDSGFGVMIFGFGVVICVCFFGFVFASEWNFGQALVASVIFGMPIAGISSIILGLLLLTILNLVLPKYAEANRILKRYDQFNEALKTYVKEMQRRQAAFWLDLSPIEFEYEVASLFNRLGHHALVTPQSGDKGIDIYITNADSRVVIQCKRYKNPATPALVRELYGALIADGADFAVLLCTGGFTSGVYEFVKDKPIYLIDLNDLLQLNNLSNNMKLRNSCITLNELFCNKSK